MCRVDHYEFSSNFAKLEQIWICLQGNRDAALMCNVPFTNYESTSDDLFCCFSRLNLRPSVQFIARLSICLIASSVFRKLVWLQPKGRGCNECKVLVSVSLFRRISWTATVSTPWERTWNNKFTTLRQRNMCLVLENFNNMIWYIC